MKRFPLPKNLTGTHRRLIKLTPKQVALHLARRDIRQMGSELKKFRNDPAMKPLLTPKAIAKGHINQARQGLNPHTNPPLKTWTVQDELLRKAGVPPSYWIWKKRIKESRK